VTRQIVVGEPPALPARIEDWTRYLKQKRTLNDHVEDVHRALLQGDQSDKYVAFLWAVSDGQAVEGSLAADNVEAARMIREYAKENGKVELMNEKLGPIVLALGVVLRRYHQSRKERRQMIDGQIIPGIDNHSVPGDTGD